MMNLGNAVSPADEVHGFRYFDARDLLGFVDGTENPCTKRLSMLPSLARTSSRSPAVVTSLL